MEEKNEIEITLKKIEKITGYELPQEFKEIYLTNATKKIGNVEIMALDEIISEVYYAADNEDDENDTRLKCIPTGTIKKKINMKERVPFITDHSGNFIGIDFKPGTKGIIGQIISYGNDEDKMVVWANSFSDFIEGINKCEDIGDIYVTDYLNSKKINFIKEVDVEKIPQKIVFPKLKKNEITEKIIHEYTKEIVLNDEVLENVLKIAEKLIPSIKRDINIIEYTVISSYYRIKNYRDSLSRTLPNKTMFYKKLEEYNKEEIKGYSVTIGVKLEENIDDKIKNIGEETIFVDMEKNKILIRYKETIRNELYKNTYNELCELFK